MDLKKIKTEVFNQKAKLVHEDKYDYSKVNYVSSQQHVDIICSRHGIFQQTPTYHLSGGICPYCARNRLTREEFLEKMIDLFQDTYDFSKSDYNHKTRRKDSVTFQCSEHGKVRQRLDSLYKGYGCVKCRDDKRSKKKVTIDSSHSNWKIHKTQKGNNTIILTYKCDDTLMRIESEPFKNESLAQKHLDLHEMIINMAEYELLDSKIQKSIGGEKGKLSNKILPLAKTFAISLKSIFTF